MDKDFYINNIKILSWMANDKYQKIRFKDRIEYKKDGKLHRLDGPSIEFFSNNTEDLYYIDGEKLTLKNFKKISKTIQ